MKSRDKKSSSPFPPMTWEIFLLSWFGCGLIKFAPGTWGSLGAIPLILLLNPISMKLPFLGITLLLLALSILLSLRVEKNLGIKDPSWIVLDEVVGMMLASSFLQTLALPMLALNFFLFRLFDIVKIWPASVIDQKFPPGWGTNLDDVVSGLYAGILTWAFQEFFLFS